MNVRKSLRITLEASKPYQSLTNTPSKPLLANPKKTIKTNRTQLEKFNQYLVESGTSLDDGLTLVDVQSYITYLTAKSLKASTVNLAYNAIRGFAKWSGQESCVQHIRVVKRTPILQLIPKSLERNDRNRLLRLVEQKRNLRDIAIVTILLYGGLRVGELVELNVKDIELKRGGLVYVNHGKGDKERIVPATSEVRSRVQEYLSQRGDVALDDPLFL